MQLLSTTEKWLDWSEGNDRARRAREDEMGLNDAERCHREVIFYNVSASVNADAAFMGRLKEKVRAVLETCGVDREYIGNIEEGEHKEFNNGKKMLTLRMASIDMARLVTRCGP